jgi:uncharacterized membrane protein YkgB
MTIQTLRHEFDRVDLAITGWMARSGITLLRVSVGVVFFWFGVLKLVPGLSPAESLMRVTLPLPANLLDIAVPFIGVWEMVIGLGFITGFAMRTTILLMMLQMVGAVSPLVMAPYRIWTTFPFVLTLEGQYVIKNVVLISAALVIGATVRGGRLVNEA